jgi:hypothetical protein
LRAGDEDADAVSAGRFGGVDALVGGANQLLGTLEEAIF